jgi:hypothetical protein
LGEWKVVEHQPKLICKFYFHTQPEALRRVRKVLYASANSTLF